MPIDENLLRVIHAISSPLLTEIMLYITTLGGVAAVMLLTGVLVIFLMRMKRWRAALFAGVSVGGVLVANSLLKLLFERERPVLYNLAFEPTYSFPSGHAAMSMALALVVIIIAWHTRWRKAVMAIGTIYVVLIGFSRLYLAVHYPTDVLAGWILASVWVLAVATLLGIIRWSPGRQTPKQ